MQLGQLLQGIPRFCLVLLRSIPTVFECLLELSTSQFDAWSPFKFGQIFSVVTLGQKKVVLPFMGLLLDLVVGIPTLTVVTVYSTLRFPKL